MTCFITSIPDAKRAAIQQCLESSISALGSPNSAADPTGVKFIDDFTGGLLSGPSALYLPWPEQAATNRHKPPNLPPVDFADIAASAGFAQAAYLSVPINDDDDTFFPFIPNRRHKIMAKHTLLERLVSTLFTPKHARAATRGRTALLAALSLTVALGGHL